MILSATNEVWEQQNVVYREERHDIFLLDVPGAFGIELPPDLLEVAHLLPVEALDFTVILEDVGEVLDDGSENEVRHEVYDK